MWPLVSYLALLTGIVVGSLLRWPLGDTQVSLRLLDFVVGLLATAWTVRAIYRFSRWRTPPIGRPTWIDYLVLAFQLILLVTYLLSWRFDWLNTVGSPGTAAAYLLRLEAYLTIYWVARTEISRLGSANIIRYFVWSTVIVAVVGIIQLFTFSDLQFLLDFGWDPHVGRLVSTFFDPNFAGIYIGFGLTLAVAQYLFGESEHRRGYLVMAIILLLALYFTYSRGAMLSTAIGATLVGFRRHWLAGLITAAIFCLLIFSPGRLGNRFLSFFTTTRIGNGQDGAELFTGDDTGNQRLLSWQRAVAVIRYAPLTGVGYNNFAPATVHLGVRSADDLDAAAAQSSDSSLLTIWATSGVIGFGAMLLLALSLLKRTLLITRERLASSDQAWLLGFGGVLVALGLDSTLINSALYPQLVITWLILAALVASQE